MPKPKALSREQVADAAYALAQQGGPASVNVRAVAAACGVATGTVYNYFPTKAELVAAAVGRFWREELADQMHEAAEPGADYVDFCREFFAATRDALAHFRRDWLPQVAGATGASGMAGCPEAERGLAHMRDGLARVLEGDPRVRRERLVGELAPERVAALTLATLMAQAEGGEAGEGSGVAPADPKAATGSFDTFCHLLRLALYDAPA